MIKSIPILAISKDSSTEKKHLRQYKNTKIINALKLIQEQIHWHTYKFLRTQIGV